jgi:hypothetical protein
MDVKKHVKSENCISKRGEIVIFIVSEYIKKRIDN